MYRSPTEASSWVGQRAETPRRMQPCANVVTRSSALTDSLDNMGAIPDWDGCSPTSQMPQIPLTRNTSNLEYSSPLAVHQDGPEMSRAILRAALILFPDSAKIVAIQHGVVPGKQGFAGQVVEFLAEPARQRNGESLFAAPERFGRQDVAHGLLENVFASGAAQLEL